MPGSTTRLSLYKPGGGSSGSYGADESADIDKINDNMDKLDAAVGARNVTSTTRPSSPYDGQLIKETDTGKLLIWRQTAGQWEPTTIEAKGTTALRDLYWGGPSTPAQRVALANSIATWWNTDKGWMEQYFAQFDDAGVSATTPVRTVFGWAPADAEVQLANFTLVGGTPANVSKRGSLVVTTGTTATIALDGVFTDDFDDYEIYIDVAPTGSAADLRMQMRLAGATVAAGQYAYNRLEATNVDTVVGDREVAQTSFIVGRTDANGARCKIELGGPKTTRRTIGLSESMDSQTYERRVGLFHDVTAAHDGFILFPSVGTFPSGTRVYVKGKRS